MSQTKWLKCRHHIDTLARVGAKAFMKFMPLMDMVIEGKKMIEKNDPSSWEITVNSTTHTFIHSHRPRVHTKKKKR